MSRHYLGQEDEGMVESIPLLSAQPARVLLADDEAGLREPLAEFLHRHFACHVETASDAARAWELARAAEQPYHVALIGDLLAPAGRKQPIRSGIELMKRIKTCSPRTEVIIFTNEGMDRVLAALRAGAFRCLAKPFNRQELAILIRRAARQHDLIKERDGLRLLIAASKQLNLSHLELENLLREIITLTVINLGANEGSLFVIGEDGTLHHWRSFGQPEMLAEKARIIGAQGCAGWVMRHGESVCLNDFRADPRWLVLPNDPLQQGSALLVPLKCGEKALGAISLTSAATAYFNQEHQALLESIASQAAIAISHAALFRQTRDLVGQLNEQKQKLDRVVECSPNGIIAIDTKGRVNIFNERAQETLGYREDEAKGKRVHPFYWDRGEPQRVSELLKEAPGHKLLGYPTFVKSKDGRRIPILLSAAYWHNAAEELIGSIGYFEDQTKIQKTKDRLTMLSKASEVMARAESIDEGLAALAEYLVKYLNRGFCGIFLLNEGGSSLALKAAYPCSEPQSEYKVKISDCALLRDLFDTNQHKIISRRDPGRRRALDNFSARLRLTEPAQSLLLVPLMKGEKIVGLLCLGEARSETLYLFTEDDADLAVAVAHQITGLIDRLRQLEIAAYRGHLLARLTTALFHIESGKEIHALHNEIARQAAELLDYAMSFLFAYLPHRRELELCGSSCSDQSIKIRLPDNRGLLGAVIRDGRPRFELNYSKWAERESAFDQFNFKTFVAVPLKSGDQIEYVLVAADGAGKQFIETDEEVLERLGSRASLALQNARLASQKEKVYKRLNILRHLTFYIQKILAAENLSGAERLERLLHVMLTGITAGYGLGFNRAAIFLMDEWGEHFVGRCGIGQFDEGSADTVWKQLSEPKLGDFFEYARLLEQGKLPETPVGAAVRGLRLPVKPAAPNFISEMLDGKHAKGVVLQNQQLNELPEEFTAVFAPQSQLALVPLVARDQVIGLLAADNQFNHAVIEEADLQSLVTFVNSLAVVLENHRLFQQTQDAHARQQALLQASDKLVAPQEPEQLLQSIAELSCRAASAAAAGLILIDDLDQPQRVIPAGFSCQFDLSQIVRPDGVSLEVMRQGKAAYLPDTKRQPRRASPFLLRYGIRAAVCLPFFAQGRKHGVLWLAYEQPRNFLDRELEALQLYVNQAASIYDNACRLDDLKHMRDAAGALATLADPPVILRHIAELALEVLQADSAVIWSIDAIRGGFNLSDSVEVGLNNDELWRKLQQATPTEDGVVRSVLERDWVGVGDIHDQSSDLFLGDRARALLAEIGVRGFQGIALKVGDEEIGVLFVNYKRRRRFSVEEHETARTFANHAALALRRTRLLKQVTDARNAAKVVAQVTALGDLDKTLNLIADRARELTRCEPVMLFVYDQQRDSFKYPPTMVGVEDVTMASRYPVLKDSIVYKVMEHGGTVIANDVLSDPWFKETDFAKRERIKSALAVPLKIGEESVGVLFVNDRSRHNFTENERNNIELLAHQAAVAISNSRNSQEQRAAALQILSEAGSEIVGLLDEGEVIQKIIRQVWKLASKENSFASVRKVIDGQATLAAFHPAPPLSDRPIIINPPEGERRGITGRVVTTKQSQLVEDVTKDPDYMKYHELTRAELTTPIIIDGEVDYAINLEHPDLNAFNEEDQRALESLAILASMAIQNARRRQSLIDADAQVKASMELSWMDMVSGMWRHEIEGKANVIATEIAEILDNPRSRRLTKEQTARLTKVKGLAEMIQSYKITPPVSSEEGVVAVSVSDLLTERFRTLWQNDPDKSVEYKLCLPPDDPLEVIISPDWLQHACDLVIDNAVRAVKNSARKEISVTASRDDGWIEIVIADTGCGISQKALDKLFKGIISKADGGEGLGGGLLKAQAIIKHYGGKIWVGGTETTGETPGTTMIIQLPPAK